MKTHDSSSGKRGAILGVVLIMVAVMTTLGTGMIALNGAHALDVSKAVAAKEAFWTAEAGLEFAKAIAAKNRTPLANIPQFSGGQLTGVINGRQYVVTYPAPAGWDNATSRVKRYDITSVGTSASGVSRQVALQAEIQTFASYMHASHFERTSGGSRIYFGGSDVLDGTVYVNDELNIYGYPQLLSRAFSAANTVNYLAPVRTGVDMTVFQSGLTLGARPLELGDPDYDPDDFIDALQTAATAGGLVLNGTYRMVFNNNGTVTTQRQRGRNRWYPPVTSDLSTGNGAIYVSGDAYVSGEVQGSVTVAARSDIFLEDDITYASATTADHSDAAFDDDAVADALGLIARNNVEVTSRDEINIHASILVTAGGFGCEGRYEVLGEPRINLFGGMTQYRRGIVGQLSSPPRGFAKNYRYDSRLLVAPPAMFPYSAYTHSNWRQER